jgi:hypothetical protein
MEGSVRSGATAPALSRQPAPELTHQACLADTRVANDGDEVRPGALEAQVCRLQMLELCIAPDENTAETADSPRAHERHRAHDLAAGDAGRLPLCLHRRWLAELKCTTRGDDRALPGEHLSWRRRLLEPGGDVDSVSRDEGTALARSTHDDLSCIDPDPKGQLALEELVEPLLHRESGM